MDTFEFFIFKIFVVKCTLITSFEGDFEKFPKSNTLVLSCINPNCAGGGHNVPALFSEGYFSMKKGV